MRYISALNVNDAFPLGIGLLKLERKRSGSAIQPSRAGEVVVMPCPVTTSYARPWQRVLFEETRDANPFFHLFEALWMLSGRCDAKWLDTFVKNFSSRYAETSGLLHGAYGHRWRHHFTLVSAPEGDFGFDQVQGAINLLKANPNDRRVVIQMWNPEVDFGANKKDIPCNLCVVPRVRTDYDVDDLVDSTQVLDITVMCRSNDAIWGCYGANAVHFSMLQEYLAAKIGVGIGTYYQISNNFHAYTDVLDKQRFYKPDEFTNPYTLDRIDLKRGKRAVVHMPLANSIDGFDNDLNRFMNLPPNKDELVEFETEFFSHVVQPMHRAHFWYRDKKYDHAFGALAQMPSNNDWYRAACAWLKRRYKELEAKAATPATPAA
jgi:thymidylate synthase